VQGNTTPKQLAAMVRELLENLAREQGLPAPRGEVRYAMPMLSTDPYPSGYGMLRWANQYEPDAATRQRNTLLSALPRRERDEPVLAYLNRCQNLVVEVALWGAAQEDDDLTLDQTERGWLLTHRKTGQRVEVYTRQKEVQRE
jgi:hypothetical protein